MQHTPRPLDLTVRRELRLAAFARWRLRHVLRASVTCLAALGVAGCAGGTSVLQLRTPQRDQLMELPALIRELGPLVPADAPALAVGTRDDELLGLVLAPGGGEPLTWRRPARVTQPALAAGGVVVFGEGARLSALRAATGEPLWSVPSRGAELVAAADDGALTALTLHVPPQNKRSLLVLDRQGRELLTVRADTSLGVPALLRGTLIVPWGELVSLIDVGSRAEVGRARLAVPLQHAIWLGAGLFLGGPPWLPLGVAPSPAYDVARRPLPGAVQAGPGSVAEADVTRLYVLPEPAGGGVYMATYGRVALGIDAARGALLWVLALPGRALAGAAGPGAFSVCDASGGLRRIGAGDGRGRGHARLAPPRRDSRAEPSLRACSLSANFAHASAGSTRAELKSEARAAPGAPLVEQLAQVLALADPELADAQRFLARELAARPEPEATGTLIELAQRRSASPSLQADAEDLLATRRNGQELMLRALAAPDASGPSPGPLPPLGPLADALAALDESRAAPLLARQLNHPGHSAGAAARAAAALERLAGEAEYASLSVYFLLHRSIADQPERVRAVNAIGRTLLRIGGERGRTLVQQVVKDPLTVPEVREAMRGELGSAP